MSKQQLLNPFVFQLKLIIFFYSIFVRRTLTPCRWNLCIFFANISCQLYHFTSSYLLYPSMDIWNQFCCSVFSKYKHIFPTSSIFYFHSLILFVWIKLVHLKKIMKNKLYLRHLWEFWWLNVAVWGDPTKLFDWNIYKLSINNNNNHNHNFKSRIVLAATHWIVVLEK